MYTTDEVLNYIDDIYLAYRPFRELCDTGAIRTNLDAAEDFVLHLDTYDKEYPLMFPTHKLNKTFVVGQIEKYFNGALVAINSAVNGINDWLTNNSVRLHQYEADLFRYNGITVSPSNIFPLEGQNMFSLKDVVLEVPTNVALTPGSSGNLADGTYYVQVSALNTVGETTPTSELSVSVTAGGTGSIGVSWDAVTGATGYAIYMSNTSGSEKFVASVTTTSYTITDMPTSTITPLSVNTAHEIVDGITIDTSATGAAKVAYVVTSSGANDLEIQIAETLEDGSSETETITIPANSPSGTQIELTNLVTDITGIHIDRTNTGSETDKGDFVTIPDRVITTH